MKIAWFGYTNLADPSQHATNMRLLLRALAGRGHQVRAMSSDLFSHVARADTKRALARLGFSPTEQTAEILERHADAIHELVLPVSDSLMKLLTQGDVSGLIETMLESMTAFGPDIVLVSAPSQISDKIALMTNRLNVPVIVCSDGAGQGADHAQLVFSAGKDMQPSSLSTLMLPTLVEAKPLRKRKGRYITYVDPTWDNGAMLYFQVIQHVNSILAGQKTLIVQTQGQIEGIEKDTGWKIRTKKNLDVIQHPWFDFDYLSTTKVLLMPHLSAGSGKVLALEAASLGIPVLASNLAPYDDVFSETGSALPVSDQLKRDPVNGVTSADIVPWALALSSLLTDDEFYQTQSDAMAELAARHSVMAVLPEVEQWLMTKVSR